MNTKQHVDKTGTTGLLEVIGSGVSENLADFTETEEGTDVTGLVGSSSALVTAGESKGTAGLLEVVETDFSKKFCWRCCLLRDCL